MPTPEQLAELDAVIAQLKQHPEQHNQMVWIQFEGKVAPTLVPELTCGSAFCIAGAVVARAGATALWEQQEDYDGDLTNIWNCNTVVAPDGLEWGVSRYARKVLGLNPWQADALFSGSNTMDDIDRVRDRIAQGDDFELR